MTGWGISFGVVDFDPRMESATPVPKAWKGDRGIEQFKRNRPEYQSVPLPIDQLRHSRLNQVIIKRKLTTKVPSARYSFSTFLPVKIQTQVIQLSPDLKQSESFSMTSRVRSKPFARLNGACPRLEALKAESQWERSKHLLSEYDVRHCSDGLTWCAQGM